MALYLRMSAALVKRDLAMPRRSSDGQPRPATASIGTAIARLLDRAGDREAARSAFELTRQVQPRAD